MAEVLGGDEKGVRERVPIKFQERYKLHRRLI